MSDPNSPSDTPQQETLRTSGDFSDLVATSLRQPEALRSLLRSDASAVIRLLTLIVPAMAMVGLLIATFSGGAQFLWVPVKVVLGTLAAMAVCLPSLFVFSNLAGSNVDLRQAIGSMVVAVAVLALVLLALSPVAMVFSLSTDSSVLVGWIHVAFLLIGGWFGGTALRRIWESEREARSQAAGFWMVLFIVVLLQLATTFRPLIGEYRPLDLEDKKIFLEHWLGSDRRN